MEAEEQERMLLREQVAREQFSRILESIGHAFFAVDDGWRFTYVNGRAEELWVRSNGRTCSGRTSGKSFRNSWLRSPTGR